MLLMAAYGEPTSHVPGAFTSYEPHPLPLLNPVFLSLTLDLIKPCRTTHVPLNDDWHLLEFSYFYSDLHEEDINIDSAYCA